ncbi:MAG: hypothetical protein QM767_15380 [Anaeromyxobacter sp.]
MATPDWKRLISSLEAEAAFHPAAAAEQVRQTEAALGVALTVELRSLVQQSDGVTGASGAGLVWPVQPIRKQNRHFRTLADLRKIYMPFDPLLRGRRQRRPVRIQDLRRPGRRERRLRVGARDRQQDLVAPSLERYLEWILSGKIQT